MKNLKIDLPYKKTPEEKMNNQEISFHFVTMGVEKKYEQGLSGGQRRLWGRLQKKFDDAIDDKKESVELEEAEFDFVKKVFGDEVKFPPRLALHLSVLEDEIERCGKEGKEVTPEEE